MKKIIGILAVVVAAVIGLIIALIRNAEMIDFLFDKMIRSDDHQEKNAHDISKLKGKLILLEGTLGREINERRSMRKDLGELQHKLMMEELEKQRNKYIATSSKDSPHWNRDLDKEINDLKEEIENKIEEMEERRD